MKGMQPVLLNEFVDECVALLISWLFFILDAWLFLGLSHRHAAMKSNCINAERREESSRLGMDPGQGGLEIE